MGCKLSLTLNPTRRAKPMAQGTACRGFLQTAKTLWEKALLRRSNLYLWVHLCSNRSIMGVLNMSLHPGGIGAVTLICALGEPT